MPRYRNSTRHHALRADLEFEMPRQLTAPELLAANLQGRELMLDPFLGSNSLSLLYGPRGLGKTFVAMGIAAAVAGGGSFLGWKADRPRRVLYIDGEMSAISLQERLRMLGAAPPTLKFLIADLATGAFPDLGYMEGQIRLMTTWGKPELVVLDNLASLAGVKTGNADYWTEMQRFLLMQRRHGRAMLIVHHANKQGLQRGTNRREDVLDVVMALRRPADYQPQDGARFDVHFEKARGLYGDAVQPIEAKMETDNHGVAHWTWRPTHLGELERYARMLEQGMNASQIAVEMGISKSRSYRLRERVLVSD
jgi:DNA-binding CsgD family transcriptional regulator